MAVHEEVFRAWPALARAIADRRADLQVRTRLRRDADTWASNKRGQVSLTGGSLDVALDWARRNPGDVTGPVQTYLAAARRQRLRRRLLIAVVPILAAIAIVVGVLALQANDARQEAEALLLAGDARATFDSRLDLGLLLALQAGARSDDLQVQSVALVALTRGPGPRQYQGPGTTTGTAALDQAGSHAVLAGPDATVLWDLGLGRAVASLPGSVQAVAISPAGTTIALARPDAVEVRHWSDAAADLVCAIGDGSVERLQFSVAGDHLITVTIDRANEPPTSRIALVRTSDCRELAARPITGVVTALGLDPTDQRLALGTEGSGVVIWDLPDGTPYLMDEEDVSAVRAVALGPDGRLAGMTADGELLDWDDARTPSTAQRIHVYDDTFGTAIRFMPDGRTLTAALDGHIAVVDPESDTPLGTPLLSLPDLDYGGPVGILDVAATSTGAVTVDPSGRLVTWDLTGQPPLGPRLMSDVRIDRIAATADGSVLAAGGSSVMLLDTSGDVRSRLDGAAATALATRGGTLAVGTEAGDVLVGSKTLEALRSVGPKHDGAVVGVALLPGGAVASVDGGGGLIVVPGIGDTQTADLSVTSHALVANESHLFIGARDGSVRVVDPSDPSRTVGSFAGHSSDVTSMAMRPDGRSLATGGDDRSIIIWDVAPDGGLKEARRLTGHRDKVTSLAYSVDGLWLASAGEDHHVILWDVASGAGIGDSIAVSGVPAVAFDSVGDRQLLVSVDGLVRWDMRPESWVRISCAIASGRTFTKVELARYFRTDPPVDVACP